MKVSLKLYLMNQSTLLHVMKWSRLLKMVNICKNSRNSTWRVFLKIF